MSSIGRGPLRCKAPGCGRVRPYWADHCAKHRNPVEKPPAPPRVSVRGVKLVGERWVNGTRSPGFGQALLSDGRTVYIPEAEARGFRGVLDFCDALGYDTKDERARVAEWVRTGA